MSTIEDAEVSTAFATEMWEAKLAASNVEDCGQFSRAKGRIAKKDGCNISCGRLFLR